LPTRELTIPYMDGKRRRELFVATQDGRTVSISPGAVHPKTLYDEATKYLRESSN